MPEKSRMDAALCLTVSPWPIAGGACCPAAGPAAAANVTNNVANKGKFRCTFMSTSLHELLGMRRHSSQRGRGNYLITNVGTAHVRAEGGGSGHEPARSSRGCRDLRTTCTLLSCDHSL